MVDVVDAATRSRMMAGIRSKDTNPELVLRKALHRRGFRYRLHVAGLPGRPDIVIGKHKVVIFVHGCFWHRHAGCRHAAMPSTRQDFWARKFSANVIRDALVRDRLHAAGWRVSTVWECAMRDAEKAKAVIDAVAEWVRITD